MDRYDIDGIVSHAIRSGVDISPADRKEWRLFCCGLKVLGYDEATFARLSWQDAKTQKECRKVWRDERHPERYKSEDAAKGMIVDLAKKAGVEVGRFLLPQFRDRADRATRSDLNRRPATAPTKNTPPRPPQPEPCFLTMDEVRATESRAHETALYRFMCREWGESATRFVFGVYHVGASKYIAPNGLRAASTPYIDRMQRVVDCKIFHVDPATGSRKTAAPLKSWIDRKTGEPDGLQSTWAMYDKGLSDRRAKWCNFGDHLLPERRSAKVCVVESEKTALICALTYPERIWVAVGSKQNLTPERLAPYIGRELILFPDRDGYEDGKRSGKGWRTRAKELAAEGFALSLDTTIERHYPRFLTDADGNPLMDEKGEPMECKADLADLILEYRHGHRTAPADEVAEATPRKTPDLMEAERIFESYKADNPLLAAFAERMELEAVGMTNYKHDEE